MRSAGRGLPATRQPGRTNGLPQWNAIGISPSLLFPRCGEFSQKLIKKLLTGEEEKSLSLEAEIPVRPPVKVFEAEYVKPSLVDAPTRPFTVERTGAHEFTVDAPWLERILAGTNVEDYESLQYFQTQLGDSGILDELVRQNVEEDDTIKIGEYEFDYVY